MWGVAEVACHMTRHPYQGSAAARWIPGVFAVILASQSAAMFGGFAMSALAILPPILLWFWWHDPEPSMSQSIHEARNGIDSRGSRDRD
jgi:hypothetical protein